MSYIISINYLLKFLIFIYIIPIYITIESKIKFAFLNGFNVIRCSDDQVQVYESKDNSDLVLSNVLKCNNKADILFNGYAGYQWNTLKIICSSQSDQVHEELFITRQIYDNKGIKTLPDIAGQLGQSGEVYDLNVEQENDDEAIIKSNDQPANDAYFDKKTNPKERRIYIWFEDHPIICRVKFTGEDDNPCSSEEDQDVENVNYACYYNPGSETVPSIQEMEAEFKQVKEASKSDDTGIYVLDLEKPDITTIDPSDSASSNPSKNKPPHKAPFPNKPSKTKPKSSIIKIIGSILGILLLILLIGGIAFYMIRKNRLNKSLSSSTNIENGDNKGSSSFPPNEYRQSLENDTNREISMNEPSRKEKPNIALQKSTANKRQRTGTNMVFNEDI